jgi:cytochrome c peroxidase
MRSIRIRTIALLVVVAAGCMREGDRQAAIAKHRAAETAATRVSGGEVATRPLSRAELAVFAPLPSFMTTGGSRPSEAEVKLGRRLYYETVLSGGHDVSCNTCHALNGYGADGRRVSFGSHGMTGGRNAPTVYNAAGQIAQFWDGRAPSVEEQAKGPILNPAEMAMPNSGAVLDHMRASPEYRAAFRAAFPNEAQPITYDNVGRAIGAFERGLVTPSRWDKFLAGDSSALTADEQRGAATFVRVGCAGCHNGPYVGGQSYQKLGLVKPWPSSTDSGRIKVTHNPADLFVFKVPTLRNVEKTGPYFHDGSVASLDEAIRLMGRHQLGKELTDAQVRDIHVWLGSLTGELPKAYIAEPQLPKSER